MMKLDPTLKTKVTIEQEIDIYVIPKTGGWKFFEFDDKLSSWCHYFGFAEKSTKTVKYEIEHISHLDYHLSWAHNGLIKGNLNIEFISLH